jgi:hypothetical protein
MSSSDELRAKLTDGELYRLASLVGTDAKTPFTNLVNYVERLIPQEVMKHASTSRGYQLGYEAGKQEAVRLAEGVINDQVLELCYFDIDTPEHKERGILIPVKALQERLQAALTKGGDTGGLETPGEPEKP